MVQAGGEPLLARLLRWLAPLHDDPTPVFIASAGDPHVPAFAAANVPGARVVLQERPDGVANAVLLAAPLLRAGPVLVVLGDLFLEGRLPLPAPQAPALVVWPEGPPASTRANFGVATGADGAVSDLVEKPADTEGLVCGVGAYLLTRTLIESFARAPVNAARGEREITEALRHTLREGARYATWPLHGRYVNVNTPADLAEVSR
jgi:dTDP-glucose pyrophosphorylase